ncbi:hypothetical protein ABZ442_04990 [Streptomyces triculaminicus]|uniref:hypothetical protein n=1 Tax=Streptomyces triculaminicus TaxID=2816232 RepID=UPI0033DFB688
MSENTLFRSLDLIEPGDLVNYHGSLTDWHGLYIVELCNCGLCRIRDVVQSDDVRYRLIDPWTERDATPRCVRRQSITRSTACA